MIKSKTKYESLGLYKYEIDYPNITITPTNYHKRQFLKQNMEGLQGLGGYCGSGRNAIPST